MQRSSPHKTIAATPRTRYLPMQAYHHLVGNTLSAYRGSLKVSLLNFQFDEFLVNSEHDFEPVVGIIPRRYLEHTLQTRQRPSDQADRSSAGGDQACLRAVRGRHGAQATRRMSTFISTRLARMGNSRLRIYRLSCTTGQRSFSGYKPRSPADSVPAAPDSIDLNLQVREQEVGAKTTPRRYSVPWERFPWYFLELVAIPSSREILQNLPTCLVHVSSQWHPHSP